MVLGYSESKVYRVDSLVVSLFIFAFNISHDDENFFEIVFLVWKKF